MATSGTVIIKTGDGEAGIDIIEGATPTIPPLRVFNASNVLLAQLGILGGWNVSALSAAVQQVSTTPVILTGANGVVVVDATAAPVVLTLPAANVATPFGTIKQIIKKDSTTNTVTINRAGADTIGANAYTSVVLQSQGAAITLQSDGVSVWHPIPENFAADSAQYRTQATTPVAITQSDYAVGVDATGGAATVNLPAANAVPRGFPVKIKKIDVSANAVTVTRAGADTIEGATTAALAAQWNSVNLTSDGVSLWLKF